MKLYIHKVIEFWYDNEVHAGEEWDEIIAQHILDSTLILSFFSKNALSSHNCREEIKFALGEKKELIRINLEEINLTPGLRMRLTHFQSIAYYDYNSLDDFIFEIRKSSKMGEHLIYKAPKSKPVPVPIVSKYDGLSNQEKIDLYIKKNGRVFDFVVDGDDHVRIEKYYDSPKRESIQIPEFVYGFERSFAAKPFSKIKHLKEIHIHPNFKDLSFMFCYSNIEKLDLSDWDVSNVTDMGCLFCNSQLKSVGELNNWNVSKNANTGNMFYGTKLSIPIWYKN